MSQRSPRSDDALAAGETIERITLLPAWRETTLYVINSWNRLAITGHSEPGHYQPGDHS